jgi:hypothetical protein
VSTTTFIFVLVAICIAFEAGRRWSRRPSNQKKEAPQEAFTTASLQKIDSVRQIRQSDAEQKIVKAVDSTPVSGGIVKPSRPQRPLTLKKWQAFMHDLDSAATFHDYDSTFQHSQSSTIVPELKSKLDGFGLEVSTAVFAVSNGAVRGFWLDDFHNYFAILVTKESGAPVDHVAVISLGQP